MKPQIRASLVLFGVLTAMAVPAATESAAHADSSDALYVCDNGMASGWNSTSARFCIFTNSTGYNSITPPGNPGAVYGRGSTWSLGSLNGLSKSTKNRFSYVMRAYPSESYGGTAQCNTPNQARSSSISAKSLAGLAGTTC